MRNKFFLLIIALFLICNLTGYSQKEQIVSLNLTVQEAVDYALEKNYDLLNADLEVFAAKKRVWETISGGLPHISGAFNYQHIPGEIPVISFNDTMSFPAAVRNTATYNLTVSQLVFSGEYIVGLMATDTYLQLSRSNREKSRLEIQANVMTSYYNILVLQSNLNILDSTINNLNESLKEARLMFEQGFMEETDYEQIQVTINTNKNAQKALENQLLIARYLFKIQLGLSNEDKVTLTENLENILERVNYEALLESDFELVNSIDYQLLELQEDVSALNLKREKAAFLPSISAFYTYQDKTKKAVFDFTINHIIGININVPLFSSGQRLSRVKQAQIELEKTENNKAKMEEMITMDAQQARLQFINAYENYQIQKKNIELARKIYNRTAVKLREGMASSMDLNQANNQYLNNYSAYTNSISELLNARVRYKKALNIL